MIKPPYTYFGGKRLVAKEVWRRFGDTYGFIDPFMGSNSILLSRPLDHKRGHEIVNDSAGMITNFWRAVKYDPYLVFKWANWPVLESHIHACHLYLLQHKFNLTSRLEADLEYYDAKIAGIWLYGTTFWMGRGWVTGKGGPYRVVGNRLVRDGGGNNFPSIVRQKPSTSTHTVKLKSSDTFFEYIKLLSERMKNVIVLSGDWTRVLASSTIPALDSRPKLSSIFLDPPYMVYNRQKDLYDKDDNNELAISVYRWALENGDNPYLRIALCGYQGHYDMPSSWTPYYWKTGGGYSSVGKSQQSKINSTKEVVWFNRSCLL